MNPLPIKYKHRTGSAINMDIFYDHQIFSSQVFGGISRYFYQLISRLNETGESHARVDVIFSNNYYYHTLPEASSLYFFKNYNFIGKNRILECINRIRSLSILDEQSFDLFHPTYNNPYFLNKLGKKPFVVTVHDMIHELYPDLPNAAKEAANKKEMILNANGIIVPSEHTKKDILKLYNIDADKINVIYHGRPCLNTQNSSEKVELPDQYLLFVGQRNYYKNFPLLLKAFYMLKKDFPELCIICVGGGCLSNQEKLLTDKYSISDRVIQLNLSDSMLNTAYKKAKAFIFPSEYEGFGIPVLEAFENECPVLLANSSCFPEIAQNAALYFENGEANDLANNILDIMNKPDLRDRLTAAGQKRCLNFSWERTTLQTEKLYSRIVNSSASDNV